MVSAKRRLSDSYNDVQARVTPESPGKQGFLNGPFGQWLEEELDYQRNMLPGIDNMWLLLTGGENDFNPVCASIYTFAEEVSFEGLLNEWNMMTTRYPAYRQRLTGLNRRFHTVRMEEDTNFDIRNHVHGVSLPDGANGKAALEDAMADFIAQDWDLGRPLWEAKVIYNYRDETGAKSAMIARAHHTLSDGQGFVLSQLSTTSARTMIEKKLAKAATNIENLETGSAKLSDLPIAGVSSWLKPLDWLIPSFVVTLLFWCLHLVFVLISVVYGLYAGVNLAVLYLTFRPKGLRYEGSRPVQKEFSFSESISIDDIKIVQKAFSTKKRHITLNDVMTALVSSCIQKHCQAVGEKPDRRIALFIPISVRRPNDQQMGNQSTGMIAYFRAQPGMSTKALIEAAHDEMKKLKISFLPLLFFKILGLLYRTPILLPSSTSWIIEDVLTSFHGVLTNVPGPQMPIEMDGSRVLRWTASPPQAGKGVLGIGMISYDGHLVWTVTADKIVGKHEGIARKLTQSFHETFNEFLVEARQLTKD